MDYSSNHRRKADWLWTDDDAEDSPVKPLRDSFLRNISYLRLSVVDKCDLRCRYCLPEKARFMPSSRILSADDMGFLARAFVSRGVRHIRLTGGEPLVRPDIIDIIGQIAPLLTDAQNGGTLDELTMTSNGTQLVRYADALKANGMDRINISLDSLNEDVFAKITRFDRLDKVLAGINAADKAGLSVKINMVVLQGVNDGEVEAMIRWAHSHGFAISLIEIMPMGGVTEDRKGQFLGLDHLRETLSDRLSLSPVNWRSSGPSRYYQSGVTGGKVGFITPLTQNFCDGCNRVRVSADGQLHMCLGHDGAVNLRDAIKARDGAALNDLLQQAMVAKPRAHDFGLNGRGQNPSRPMAHTGG